MKLQNPLEESSEARLQEMVQAYCKEHAIGELDEVRAFGIGAVLAKVPENYDKLSKYDATPEEFGTLKKEFTNRWWRPPLLYLVIVVCSTCAAVQGMNETVVNRAQLVSSVRLGLTMPLLTLNSITHHNSESTTTGYVSDLAS